MPAHPADVRRFHFPVPGGSRPASRQLPRERRLRKRQRLRRSPGGDGAQSTRERRVQGAIPFANLTCLKAEKRDMATLANTRRFLPCPSCGSAMRPARVATVAGDPPNPVFICLYCNHLEARSEDAAGETASTHSPAPASLCDHQEAIA